MDDLAPNHLIVKMYETLLQMERSGDSFTLHEQVLWMRDGLQELDKQLHETMKRMHTAESRLARLTAQLRAWEQIDRHTDSV